ncbi:MAG: phenylalanine--tRNA ligase subunit beta [Eubacteriales bacterium]|nr:phenylalanine--tRNA ligase subunit beta [Eubacteriales bacterium]
MKTSIKFLKRFVPKLEVNNEAEDRDFAERITLSGTKVETYKRLNTNIEKVVACRLIKVEKHKDADKLFVCMCDIGTNGNIQIVTGADNIYEGMMCPCVLAGGKVPASAHDDKIPENGYTIKKGTLRGIESNGMLCSIQELGVEKDLFQDLVDGIFDLKEFNCSPGDDISKVMGLDNTFYDFEITSNRVDCYSTLGIARETSATFGLDFIKAKTIVKSNTSEKNYIDIEIKDKNKCSIYASRLVKNIKIEKSPMWMQELLRSVGIRPINNIVDITNYVMMEYGYPMHAYNYDSIKDKKIIIKCAQKNEKFTTLDDKEYQLDEDTLCICDNNGIIGLAGIMGGENSMITNDTKNLLLECANFDGTNIRLTSKKIGIRTEASNLFEKGLDKYLSLEAIDRACELIEELNAGEVCKEKIVAYIDDKGNNQLIDESINKLNAPINQITVSAKKINSILGTSIEKEKMKDILDKIELFTKIDDDNLIIDVPSWRKDIHIDADIAEEVIRFVGYDKIEETYPNTNISPELKSKKEKTLDKAYDIALHSGFSEAKNYSFESKKVYDKLCFEEDAIERDTIKILNPLGEDFSQMRTQLINGMMLSLSFNYRNKNKDVKLFEIAKKYVKTNPNEDIISTLPIETNILSLGAYGNIDFLIMKGIIEELLISLGIKRKAKYIICDHTKRPYYHQGRCADVFIGKELVAHFGEINKNVSDNYDIDRRVYISQINIDILEKLSNFDCYYKPIPKYPEISRDLSLIVPFDKKVELIESIIEKNGSKLLESFKLFDIYEGTQLKEGFKSISYSLSFRSNDHTLVDEEVDTIIQKIIGDLSQNGIELRK